MNATFEKWIGLLEVRYTPGFSMIEVDRCGAFCTAIVWASDLASFERQAREYLRPMGLELVSLEEVDRYEERIMSHEVSEDCKLLAKDVCSNQPVALCTFHTFPDD